MKNNLAAVSTIAFIILPRFLGNTSRGMGKVNKGKAFLGKTVLDHGR
jgi:hypothetical protein